jgi:hypothetical protein
MSTPRCADRRAHAERNCNNACPLQPLKLTEGMQWPSRMPREGRLEVDFKSNLPVADKKIPVSEEQFEHVFRPNLAREADVSDTDRATFCEARTLLQV